FEIEEIEELHPSTDDEERLLAARARLGRLDGLRAAAGAGAEALSPEEADESGAATALAEADRLSDGVAGAVSELETMAGAPRPADAGLGELGQVAMEAASSEVQVEDRGELGAAGRDRVLLSIAPSPGVPSGLLREVGSGGEPSRVMLALMSAGSAGGARTLVF